MFSVFISVKINGVRLVVINVIFAEKFLLVRIKGRNEILVVLIQFKRKFYKPFYLFSAADFSYFNHISF